jgi:HEAT repeat protein
VCEVRAVENEDIEKLLEPLEWIDSVSYPEKYLDSEKTLIAKARNDPKTVLVLITGLKHPKWEIRGQCAGILLRIGPPAAAPAVPELACVFEDKKEKENVRRTAARALSQMGKNAVPVLAKHLRSPEVFMRRKAADELAMAAKYAEEAIPGLIEAFEDEDADVRSCASEALQRQGERAVAALREAVNNERSFVRVYAASTLVEIDQKKHYDLFLPVLVQGLKDPDENVRFRAAASLGSLKQPPPERDAMAAIYAALRDQNRWVRFTLVAALAHWPLKTKEKLTGLTKALEDADDEIPWYAAEGLRGFGADAKVAVPQLIKCLDHRSYVVREEAVMTLGAIGPDAKEALPALMKGRDDPKKYNRTIVDDAIKQIKARNKP